MALKFLLYSSSNRKMKPQLSMDFFMPSPIQMIMRVVECFSQDRWHVIGVSNMNVRLSYCRDDFDYQRELDLASINPVFGMKISVRNDKIAIAKLSGHAPWDSNLKGKENDQY